MQNTGQQLGVDGVVVVVVAGAGSDKSITKAVAKHPAAINGIKILARRRLSIATRPSGCWHAGCSVVIEGCIAGADGAIALRLCTLSVFADQLTPLSDFLPAAAHLTGEVTADQRSLRVGGISHQHTRWHTLWHRF